MATAAVMQLSGKGSNGWAIAPQRSANGHAMLLTNPHLPWFDLFLFYEAQLTAPGINAYGVSLVGFPVLGIAFNDNLGWTHTVNTFDGADLYALTLAEGGYRFDGKVRPFDLRRKTERFRMLLVSALDADVVRHMGLEPHATLESALSVVQPQPGYIIPGGLTTLPSLASI